MSVRFLTESAAHLISLKDESVQCVITSPPYWGLRKYAGTQDLRYSPEQDPVSEQSFLFER